MRVCLISLYFGEWPEYINIFLKGCRHNPSVDFILFSDCGSLPRSPENVHVEPITLQDVRERVHDCIGVKPNIKTPYHLCDFKPTYGDLFGDYLSGYDYWGYTDIDLIYGDINQFIGDYLFSERDIISVRPWWLTGFFFIFKNEDRINKLYKKSRSYREVFCGQNYYNFDECGFAWEEIRSGNPVFSTSSEIESITEVIKKESNDGNIDVIFDNSAQENIEDGFVLWENGEISYISREKLLLHFVSLKSKYHFVFPGWKYIPNKFYIDSTGFYRPHEFSGLSYFKYMKKSDIIIAATGRLLQKVKNQFSKIKRLL